MDFLNDKVTDKYCDVCGSNIKSRSKHIITKGHQKELKKTIETLNEGKNICLKMDEYLNGKNNIDTTINFLKSLM